MKTIKNFWIYFVLFILIYILVTFLTQLGMRDVYRDIKCEVKSKSPQIIVTEAKSTYSYGYINGTVTNDTGEHIKLCYLKIDLYNKNDTYLSTEYKQLEYFNATETINFNIEYTNHTNVKVANLSIVKEIKNGNEMKTRTIKLITDLKEKIKLK